MFWVISVYFGLRNILPKSGTFLPGHPVFVGVVLYCDTIVGTTINIIYVVFNPKVIAQ